MIVEPGTKPILQFVVRLALDAVADSASVIRLR